MSEPNMYILDADKLYDELTAAPESDMAGNLSYPADALRAAYEHGKRDGQSELEAKLAEANRRIAEHAAAMEIANGDIDSWRQRAEKAESRAAALEGEQSENRS